MRNPKITLRRLTNKPVLRYLRFQDVGICDQTGAEKYMWPNIQFKKKFFFFFYRFSPIIEPEVAFGSLLGSSK